MQLKKNNFSSRGTLFMLTQRGSAKAKKNKPQITHEWFPFFSAFDLVRQTMCCCCCFFSAFTEQINAMIGK